MIRILRYLLAASVIVMLTCQCTSKLLDQKEGSVDIDEQIVYMSTHHFLEAQEDQKLKYVIFQEGSLEIDEEGSDDIRDVAVYIDIYQDVKVSIVTTDEEVSKKRAEQIKILMTHFGIQKEAIAIDSENHLPNINDNVLMIKVGRTDRVIKDIARSF